MTETGNGSNGTSALDTEPLPPSDTSSALALLPRVNERELSTLKSPNELNAPNALPAAMPRPRNVPETNLAPMLELKMLPAPFAMTFSIPAKKYLLTILYHQSLVAPMKDLEKGIRRRCSEDQHSLLTMLPAILTSITRSLSIPMTPYEEKKHSRQIVAILELCHNVIEVTTHPSFTAMSTKDTSNNFPKPNVLLGSVNIMPTALLKRPFKTSNLLHAPCWFISPSTGPTKLIWHSGQWLSTTLSSFTITCLTPIPAYPQWTSSHANGGHIPSIMTSTSLAVLPMFSTKRSRMAKHFQNSNHDPSDTSTLASVPFMQARCH